MRAHITSGQTVQHAGETWKVKRVLGVESVVLCSQTATEILADPITLQDRAKNAASEKSGIPSDELRYDAADWERAEQRRAMISALAKLPERSNTHIQDAARSLTVSPRYVWRLLRLLATRGDNATTFLPVRRTKRAPRLAASAEAIIQQAIDQHYTKSSRPSMLSLVREVTGRCKAASVAPPSYQAIAARVRNQNQVWLVQRREGSAKSRALRLLTGAHPGAASPWERVQIDSTPCDIRLVSEADRHVIGRPNVTFAIDIYSRVILGFSVSLQAASTVTVATCLAYACLPKRDWLATRDLTGIHWPVWGKPAVLEYDQGPENEAKGIQRGLRLHSITGKVRAKGHPEHHGTIERLIGTMMRRVHERRGTTFASVAETR